jgi:hypothetical protein
MQGEISTGSMKIDRLRNKVLEGSIKIPPFQREFVWKQEQIIELLDSIVKDFPIGSILLWETIENLPAKRDIGGYTLPEPTEDYPINYVLDGQQRVTSIFSVFHDICSPINTDLFNIYYDIDNKVFLSSMDIAKKTKLLPLKLIFDNLKFIEFMRSEGLDKDEISEVATLQSLFQNYEIPTVTIKKKDKSEVGVIFERVNNTGTPLSTLDLMTAWTWNEDFHLQEKFDEILDILESKNFGNLHSTVILQCAGAIIDKTTKKKSILDLDSTKVRDNIDKLKASLEKAIDYLSTQYNCASGDFLPRVQQIIPLSYLFSQTNALDSQQTNTLNQWFWRTSFSNRYSSATDSKMDDDILFIDKLIAKDYKGLSSYNSEISASNLLSLKFSKSNSMVRALILLMAQKPPLDLYSQSKIDVGKSLSSYNRKEYHHIFPRNFLKNIGYNTYDTNLALNFCFLSASSNKIISSRAPSDYFINLLPQNDLDKVLDSNLIPNSNNNMQIYSQDKYKDFINIRAELIVNYIKELTGES